MLADEVQLLKRIPLFAKVEPSRLKLLAFASERQVFQSGETIVREGEVGSTAYIIVSGEADVLIQTNHGTMTVSKVGKNDFIGEVAMLCDVPRTASVRALTNVDTLCISKDLFYSLVKEFPEIAVQVMRVLAQRLERSTRLLRERAAPAANILTEGDGV